MGDPLVVLSYQVPSTYAGDKRQSLPHQDRLILSCDRISFYTNLACHLSYGSGERLKRLMLGHDTCSQQLGCGLSSLQPLNGRLYECIPIDHYFSYDSHDQLVGELEMGDLQQDLRPILSSYVYPKRVA